MPCALVALAVLHLTRPDSGRPAARPEPAEPASPSGVAPASPESPDGDARPLAGTVVVLDPGHHPANREHPEAISRQVDVGTHRKACDTTGTATEAGRPEAEFTLDLARRVRERLEERGARVVLTQDGDRGDGRGGGPERARPYGPCIDERARIGNEEQADAVVSLHADGSGPTHRGFHVILPAAVHEGEADTRAITEPSRALGARLVEHFARATGTSPATYLGPRTADSGLDVRDDLGGLNLSTVPKVFLECGNMRNAQDAALLTDDAWRDRAARGITEGLTEFLTADRA
uniref:N-acetylmuramoyl-L-alanine amidase n=1 Tax=Streptomyces sp. GSL17-111 TaxID=3121596 RepID=UPI0030F4B27F